MYEFEYQKVTSARDAKAAYGSKDDATYLAGGMTLIPTLKQRLASPTDVVDLKGIGELVGIAETDGVGPNFFKVDGETCTAATKTGLDLISDHHDALVARHQVFLLMFGDRTHALAGLQIARKPLPLRNSKMMFRRRSKHDV